MNYQEFKNMLKDRMQKIMGDTIQVGFETYTKNNQTPIESLTFQEKDSSAATVITPAIHMQDLYNLYQKEGDGEMFQGCLMEIKKLYMEQEPKSLDFINRDWGEIKKSICMTLLCEGWNKGWIEEENITYSKFLDFVIVLRSVLGVSSHGMGSMVVTQNLMSHWRITEEELWETAWNNLYCERFYIQNLNEVLRSELKEREMEIDAKLLKNDLPLYLLSNKERVYGARGILRTDLLQAFAMRADSNLYILPSSIHELILLPDNGNYCVEEEMREVVKTINETEVPETERLSETIYYFRKDSGTVEIAK